jgi:hypothetical protein
VSGFQAGSPAPTWIAVIGRHTWSAYFASYMAMVVSASARSSPANEALACARLASWSVAACWAIWFRVCQTGAELQNVPAAVSSGVRVVLVSRPRVRTSSSAAV